MARKFIGDDVAKVYEKKGTGFSTVETLYWGDTVDHRGTSGGRPKIAFRTRDKLGRQRNIEGYLSKNASLVDEGVLQVRFVDVGQGDGAIVYTPRGRVMFVDGGEGDHIRRYTMVAFRNRPLPVEAVVATHGDADHYAGLTALLEGFDGTRVIAPRFIYHNGLVKRPSKHNGKKRPDAEMFGATKRVGSTLYCTELVDDIRDVDDAHMNLPFQKWKAAVTKARTPEGKKPKMKSLAFGDTIDLFENEGIAIDVLGPIREELPGGRDGLRFLHAVGSRSASASHTVNGHSVVLKLRYGNVRFLFGADLNEESEELLLAHARAHDIDLQSEVLKVPHHGSADFSPAMLRAVAPVVSIVSSGDESTRTEYIHPRAGLVGALGRASRPNLDKPLVYVTEMVAFMQKLAASEETRARKADIPTPDRLYRKLQYGIVHIRTDGERLVIVTPSGKEDFVETYAFTVDALGVARPAAIRRA
jgi:beta-lactamase superfamily II metal-dependent hydrolase